MGKCIFLCRTTKPVALILLLTLGFFVVPTRHAQAKRFPLAPVQSINVRNVEVTLPGSVLPHLASWRRLFPLPLTQPVSVALSLRVRDEAGLHRFLHDVYDPRSSLFHHFLTPRQFAARFAPPPEEQRRLADWLQQKGLRIVQRFRNGLQLTVRGSVATVEAAFHTPLYVYRQGRARFFANARAVQLPMDLAAGVVAVVGLSDWARQEPQIRQLPVEAWQTSHPPGYSPQDLAKLYDLQPLYQQEMNAGKQSMALVEYADFSDADIATYDSRFGTSGAIERIPVKTGSGMGATLGKGQDECELDIEMVHAIAPGAHLLVYEAPNHEVGALSMWNQIVSDDRAEVVSTSWGQPESQMATGLMRATNQLLEEAVAQGQAVFAAAGDKGAYDSAGTSKATTKTRQLVVDFPASDPWVTGVGGSSLHANADGTYGSETAWANGLDPKHPEGGGGGLSKLFRRPDYQVGPGVANQYSNGMRQVPDVAADADPSTGYAIYTLAHGIPRWQRVGGTSAAAPLWAAFATVMNQVWGRPAGFLNPTLYALGRQAASLPAPPFHDITEGTNLYYPATPGWDFATGWGSFDAAALLAGVQQIGGIVPFQLPTVEFSLEAAVAITSNGRLVEVKQVRAGQTVQLLVFVTISRLAGDGDARRQLTLASPDHTLLQQTVADHFTIGDIGRTARRSIRFRLPRHTPRGSYTLTVQQTIQSDTEQATTRVRIR